MVTAGATLQPFPSTTVNVQAPEPLAKMPVPKIVPVPPLPEIVTVVEPPLQVIAGPWVAVAVTEVAGWVSEMVVVPTQ